MNWEKQWKDAMLRLRSIFCCALTYLVKLVYDPRPFSAESKQRAIRELVEDTIPDRDFYLLVIGAILLAVCGIFLDSIPVLIASMIVAPLASPLLLLSMGLAVGDRRLVARALAMLCVAMILAVVLAGGASIGAARFFGISPQRVLISFSPNYFFDIVIALVSGFIAAYGLMRTKVGAAMTGIGIAVSLMPPLVATGIEIAALNRSLAEGAFTIFVLNVLGIVLASVFAFALFGFCSEYKGV